MRVWKKEAKTHVFQTLMPHASSSLSCEFSLWMRVGPKNYLPHFWQFPAVGGDSLPLIVSWKLGNFLAIHFINYLIMSFHGFTLSPNPTGGVNTHLKHTLIIWNESFMALPFCLPCPSQFIFPDWRTCALISSSHCSSLLLADDFQPWMNFFYF